jgi:hypothetical protein
MVRRRRRAPCARRKCVDREPLQRNGLRTLRGGLAAAEIRAEGTVSESPWAPSSLFHRAGYALPEALALQRSPRVAPETSTYLTDLTGGTARRRRVRYTASSVRVFASWHVRQMP